MRCKRPTKRPTNYLNIVPLQISSGRKELEIWSSAIMINFCIVLQGRGILEEFILSIPLSGRAIFHRTLPRSYFSQYINNKSVICEINSFNIALLDMCISQYTEHPVLVLGTFFVCLLYWFFPSRGRTQCLRSCLKSYLVSQTLIFFFKLNCNTDVTSKLKIYIDIF